MPSKASPNPVFEGRADLPRSGGASCDSGRSILTRCPLRPGTPRIPRGPADRGSGRAGGSRRWPPRTSSRPRPAREDYGKSISERGKTTGHGDRLPVAHGGLPASPASASANSGLSLSLSEKKASGRSENSAVADGGKTPARAPGEKPKFPRTLARNWPSTRTNKPVLRGSGNRLEFGGKKSSRDTVGFRRRPLRSENGSSSELSRSWVSRPTRAFVTKLKHPFLAQRPAEGGG